MKFDDLDARMRVYETAHDQLIPPGIFLVVRLDGRGFTRLTKELLDLEAPFDSRFSDFMATTVEHLMQCGFRVLYGYAQSDEISLLCGTDECLQEAPLFTRTGRCAPPICDMFTGAGDELAGICLLHL